MENISINKLQNELSKITKKVEGGEVYQVSRYSKPVAYLVSKEKFEKLVSEQNCKACMEDIRKITKKLT